MGSFTHTPAPTAEERLADARSRALANLNEAYSAAARPLVKDYPDVERLSWQQQLNEAQLYREWQSAGETGTAPAMPALSAILAGRNGTNGTETLGDLVAAVLARADAFVQWQTYTGIRHRGERLIAAAKTVEAVQAVTWESLTAE